MLIRIARFWILITISGVAVYLALFMIGTISSPLFHGYLPSSGILAVAFVSLAISVLLALDERDTGADVDIEKVTFSGLVYLMLVRRKPLTVLLVLGVVGIALGTYYLSQAIGVTFESEGNSFTVKLPFATVYYFPIHSQIGWQNTGIKLKKDQQFKYAITGSVNPGFLQDIDQRSRNLSKFKLKGELYTDPQVYWQFTGPEGYTDRMYEDLKKSDEQACDRAYKSKEMIVDYTLDPKNVAQCYNTATKSYKDDTGLTVQGVSLSR